jgi:hypothetical protein
MDPLKRLASGAAPRNIRLIGDDDEQKSPRPQRRQAVTDAIENLELLWLGRVGLTVTHPGAVDDAIAVQKHGAAFHLRDDALTAPLTSRGCETNKCQITA